MDQLIERLMILALAFVMFCMGIMVLAMAGTVALDVYVKLMK